MKFKKDLLFTLFFSFLLELAYCQILYYDAVKLTEYVKDEKFMIPNTDCSDTVNLDQTCIEFLRMIKIIRPYLKSDLQKLSAIAIVTQLRNIDGDNYNPFLGPMFQEPTANSVNLERYISHVGPIAKDISASIGGLDATTVADGIARFLVERTKQELNIYFFDQFNKFLKNSDYGKDAQKLFPNSYSVLLVIGDDIYDYQQYLQSLREAFAHDLGSILLNADHWINQASDEATPLVKAIQASSIYKYLQLALLISVDLHQGKHPGDILNALAGKSFINDIDADIKGFTASVKVANLFSQSLRSNSAERYWITEGEFKSIQDDIVLKIFLGLIYQKVKMEDDEMKFGDKKFSEILKSLAGDLAKVRNILANYKQLVNEIDQLIIQLRSNEGNSVNQNYTSLFNNVENLIKISTTFPAAQQALLFDDTLESILTHTAGLLADVRVKAYNAAIIELSLILQKIPTEQTDFKKYEPLLKGVLKYGTFMANVASAKTSEEVQKAIELVALPPGSYRIKRDSKANISINGYLGLFGGNEYMPASTQNNGFSFGLSAPVGVSFSSGAHKFLGFFDNHFSSTLFFSVIDVGALAAFRFSDSNASVASKVELKNIVAPGAYYILGIGKSPISVGLGAQMGPKLRDVAANGNPDINNNYYIRYGGFIAIDIPFLTLYNRKDSKSK